MDDLQAAIEQGVPPIVLVFTRELPYWGTPTYHAVVVTGLDKDDVILNDPAFAEAGIRAPIGDFLLAWDERGNLLALLRPIR